MGTPSRAIAAPLIVHRPTPIIDAERLLLPPRAIGHQPPQQLGHLHVTAMLRFKGIRPAATALL
jgi:hypothetical protein